MNQNHTPTLYLTTRNAGVPAFIYCQCQCQIHARSAPQEANFTVLSFTCRAESLHIANQKSIDSVHKGGVTWLELDCVEHRYLLAGAADASVAAYDVQASQVDIQISPSFTSSDHDAQLPHRLGAPRSWLGVRLAQSAERALASTRPPSGWTGATPMRTSTA